MLHHIWQHRRRDYPGQEASDAVELGRLAARHPSVVFLLAHIGGGLSALLACAVLLYFAFRYAERLLRPLGEAGTIVFLRLAAFILLCLGVQIIWEGVSGLLGPLLNAQMV